MNPALQLILDAFNKRCDELEARLGMREQRDAVVDLGVGGLQQHDVPEGHDYVLLPIEPPTVDAVFSAEREQRVAVVVIADTDPAIVTPALSPDVLMIRIAELITSPHIVACAEAPNAAALTRSLGQIRRLPRPPSSIYEDGSEDNMFLRADVARPVPQPPHRQPRRFPPLRRPRGAPSRPPWLRRPRRVPPRPPPRLRRPSRAPPRPPRLLRPRRASLRLRQTRRAPPCSPQLQRPWRVPPHPPWLRRTRRATLRQLRLRPILPSSSSPKLYVISGKAHALRCLHSGPGAEELLCRVGVNGDTPLHLACPEQLAMDAKALENTFPTFYLILDFTKPFVSCVRLVPAPPIAASVSTCASPTRCSSWGRSHDMLQRRVISMCRDHSAEDLLKRTYEVRPSSNMISFFSVLDELHYRVRHFPGFLRPVAEAATGVALSITEGPVLIASAITATTEYIDYWLLVATGENAERIIPEFVSSQDFDDTIDWNRCRVAHAAAVPKAALGSLVIYHSLGTGALSIAYQHTSASRVLLASAVTAHCEPGVAQVALIPIDAVVVFTTGGDRGFHNSIIIDLGVVPADPLVRIMMVVLATTGRPRRRFCCGCTGPCTPASASSSLTPSPLRVITQHTIVLGPYSIGLAGWVLKFIVVGARVMALAWLGPDGDVSITVKTKAHSLGGLQLELVIGRTLQQQQNDVLASVTLDSSLPLRTHLRVLKTMLQGILSSSKAKLDTMASVVVMQMPAMLALKLGAFRMKADFVWVLLCDSCLAYVINLTTPACRPPSARCSMSSTSLSRPSSRLRELNGKSVQLLLPGGFAQDVLVSVDNAAA